MSPPAPRKKEVRFAPQEADTQNRTVAETPVRRFEPRRVVGAVGRLPPENRLSRVSYRADTPTCLR